MKRQSAGLIMFRVRDGVLEALLAHPGGPFWRSKDLGAWTIQSDWVEELKRLWANLRDSVPNIFPIHANFAPAAVASVVETGGGDRELIRGLFDVIPRLATGFYHPG